MLMGLNGHYRVIKYQVTTWSVSFVVVEEQVTGLEGPYVLCMIWCDKNIGGNENCGSVTDFGDICVKGDTFGTVSFPVFTRKGTTHINYVCCMNISVFKELLYCLHKHAGTWITSPFSVCLSVSSISVAV